MIRHPLKAEYLFQPRVLMRRLMRRTGAAGPCEVMLPWGRRIRLDARDNIGAVVERLGVYDLIVTETIWRLTGPGETTIDVGANVGCISAVFAERVGLGGRVISFEPHPVLYQELSDNLRSLQSQGIQCALEPMQCALGAAAGVLPLHLPVDFQSHRGESTLAELSHLEASRQTVDVTVDRFDDVLGSTAIGVMKIDVEGFEKNVFLGAAEAFAANRVRDCVFEEHGSYPTEATRLLEGWGYRLFRLDRGLLRPILRPPNTLVKKSAWEATSFLATVDAQRAERLLRPAGWQCLRRRR